MKKQLGLILLIAVALVVLSACQPAVDENTTIYQFDDTDEDVSWTEVDDAEVYRGIMNGEYVIQIRKNAALEWENTGKTYQNVEVAIDAQDIGMARDGSYGLICGYQNELNYYLGSIGSDGYYFISKSENGEDSLLLMDETGMYPFTDKIDPMAKSYHIGMNCVDGQIDLLLNDEVLGSVEDDTFSSGDIGFFAISFVETPLQINFDNFSVKEID